MDKRLDAVAHAKDLLTPVPPPVIGLSTPRPNLDSIPTQMPHSGMVKTPSSMSSLLAPWQWGLSIVSGAVFLYGSSLVIGLTLVMFINLGSPSSYVGRLLTNLALAGLAACGLVAALRDRKTTLSFILGSMVLRAPIRLLSALFTMPPAVFLMGWVILGAACAVALWQIWQKGPREAGDADRLSVALTILIAAEALTVAYVFVRPGPSMPSTELIGVAIAIGALVWARLKLPAALGTSAAAGPGGGIVGVTPSGINPLFRRFLAIIVYIAIAVVLRLLLRNAFR